MKVRPVSEWDGTSISGSNFGMGGTQFRDGWHPVSERYVNREFKDAYVPIALTGVLTAYPVDQGCFDWAEEHGLVNLKPEKLGIKRKDPSFIGSFSTASQVHYHYEEGQRT